MHTITAWPLSWRGARLWVSYHTIARCSLGYWYLELDTLRNQPRRLAPRGPRSISLESVKSQLKHFEVTFKVIGSKNNLGRTGPARPRYRT